MTPEEALALAEALPDADVPAPPQESELARKAGILGRGFGQGISLGFLDEGAAGLAAALPALDREAVAGAEGDTIGARYRAARAFYRDLARRSKDAEPLAYGTAEFGGALALPVRGLGSLVATGAASGAGHSEGEIDSADPTLARDVAIGAAVPLALGGAGAGLGAVGRKLMNRASSKATDEATKAIDEAIDSARGAYGGQRQNMSRAIEVLLRAEATGALTPQQAAQLAALKASPEWEETIRSVAGNYMSDFPGLAGAATSAKSAYQTLAQNRAGDIATKAEELLSTKEAGRLARERLKRYGAALGGGLLAGSVLGPGGAILGAGSALSIRPTLRAFGRVTTKPAWLAKEGAILDAAGRALAGPGAAAGARTTQGLALMPDEMTDEELARYVDSLPDAE
ncbi:MAG TPA: hypothetical protein VFN94_10830 [Nitrospiria bacterium]|nr:hypothetical protein [Nitrospiria bacterium]